ncbi:ABC transporter substrate-binding protein [Lentilactobacillus hilgardii]|uniref:Receptor family ligand-binding protein n=1 Tax=Lentilactobacillus hilgardii (strain ATCC 8290 / DSM 20176 / CCUG 30140 / JCM 1155 / KCTC 3500 / NBRC 15886 / NCIMB 8040 / NRRL B-1843 / 9) TaxID=1423757 RepID=C0XJE2_LENH9|nr:ABC transporter substrate-binding protein [Lentilactobacillus hilgardii]EEI20705.1 receptor family ligand-binding protein [Lentilactobacillus buchneri ATCC 11577]EEI24528.1 receptor family ligand-binding protein [Lentilactobacillus hilgardii DSM 20176 = ATCC 8290]KRK55843.1 branched-chain amino acid ABC transporter, substrate binding protein [Lentilactobacillus hilgardii DSM 20176 = ATCC 8290]MCT3394934.1 ABC transporter substrate-binding protein [Lentilactobacillus hilgardii]QEU37712.1 ABC
MKKSNMKKIVSFAAVVMTAGIFAGCSTAKTQTAGNNQTGNTIKIGVNMELSGAAAGYGNSQKQGIQLAAQEINKDGGINVNGKKKKIKLIIKDNKTSTTTSASVAAQLVNNDKVAAIVGPATTNAGTAEIPNITKAAVPSVSPSATDPNYTKQKNGKVQPYVFRACYQNNFQGGTAAKFMTNTLKAKRVAVFADNSSDYGTGLAKAFKKSFKGTIVDSQSFSEGDKDFNAVLTSFKSKKIDAIYVPGYYTEVGLIIKQARQNGINVPIVGSDGMADPKLAQIAGNKNASKIYYTTPFSDDVAKSNPTAVKFMNAYKAKYHADAPTFSALAYDSVYMIKSAIESEKSADSIKITKGLSKIKNFDGVTGTITINKNHDPEKPIAIEQLTNGKVSNSFNIK